MSWNPSIFLWLIIALFACSAISYAVAGDWPKSGYSLCAALLNVFVMMGE